MLNTENEVLESSKSKTFGLVIVSIIAIIMANNSSIIILYIPIDNTFLDMYLVNIILQNL